MNAAARQKPHTIYIHRNAAGKILYVGCCANLAARTRVHQHRSKHWPEVATVEVVADEADQVPA